MICHTDYYKVQYSEFKVKSNHKVQSSKFKVKVIIKFKVQYSKFKVKSNHKVQSSIFKVQSKSKMNKIPSFTINHNKLLRGIYVSRKDEVGGEVVTTFDIRMKVPNQEPCLHNGAIHTIEHLAATYLRNDEEWKDRIIYWGPMGCLTGNYLLIRGDLESRDIVELMKRTFKFIADYEGEIPGQAAKDCGNYLLHDLPMAKYEAKKYLEEVLNVIKDENLIYPTQD